MAYYLDLFTPETWTAFQENGSRISGYRDGQARVAAKVQKGDIFLCYLVRLSRWCGYLKVTSSAFVDNTPIFQNPDPFIHRFKVQPSVVLDLERSIPIFDKSVWSKLSLTKGLTRKSGWAQTANLRASLREISPSDGGLLVKLLNQQAQSLKSYPFSDVERARLATKRTIRAAGRDVIVEVPDAEEISVASADKGELRASHKMQAELARIGIQMGFKIWIPAGDRQAVSSLLNKDDRLALLAKLPLNYDDATLRTIEQIDVIWLRNRSMARAFEVEHTTAVYSGLLRMADLLALQPNMDIRLHIVAPDEKRSKVLREISRPVFSLLDKGPLYESCSFLSYDSVAKIGKLPYLRHTNDSVLDEYRELAQDE